MNVVSRYDYRNDFITIAFHSAKIVLENHNNESGEPIKYWGLYPTCWDIYLNKTRAFNGGYIIDDYNTPYRFRIEVWAGIPFLRNIQTGQLRTMESLY